MPHKSILVNNPYTCIAIDFKAMSLYIIIAQNVLHIKHTTQSISLTLYDGQTDEMRPNIVILSKKNPR